MTIRPFDQALGFVVYWDYILNLSKNELPIGSKIQIVYGVYG